MNESVEDISVPENEVKIENREATFIPNTEGIPEIMDQGAEGIDAIGNLVATPGPSVEGVSETMDQTIEDLRVTENLKVASASGTEVFTEMMDLDEVSDTESFVTASGSSPERINETMYETTEDISVTHNVLATLGCIYTYIIRGVMNQAVEGTSVIENIDDDIMEITSVPNTEAVLENVDITAQDITLTENFVATPDPSAKGNREIVDQEVEGIGAIGNLVATPGPSLEGVNEKIDQTVENFKETKNLKAAPVYGTEVVTEIMDPDEASVIESLVAAPESSPEEINEIMDQEAESIDENRNLVSTPGSSVEGVSEEMDQTVENLKETENLKAAPVSGIEVVTEIMDPDEVSVTESLVAAPESSPEGINEIMDQEAESTDANGNFAATPGPSVEEVSKEMDQTVQDFKVTEDLKSASASRTEVFTELMDSEEVSVTKSLVADVESITEGINKIIDETTEDISVLENIEVISLPNTERIVEINDKIAEGFGLTENLEAIPVSSTGVSETHVQNKNTTNIVLDKEMSNTENETGNETSKTMKSEAKSLKIVPGSKIKNLKRKIVHPSVSEMLINSIKSLKKSSGVSFEDIKTQMEEKYPVNVKALVKYHVINYLKKWVEMGILEKVIGADMEERFIIKASEISYEKDCIIQAKKLKIN